MKLGRKLQKLFTREAYDSFVEHARRRTHPVPVRPLLSRLDQAKWRELKQRYPHRPGAPNINRFVEVEEWMPVNVERAQDLWLDRSPSLRLLDLGCGPGYFLYVCGQLGHLGLGVDIDEVALFRETTALLGVERRIFRIQSFQPLPGFGEKFDLVTAHRICFHQKEFKPDGTHEEWRPDEWEFFLADVRANVLKPSGRLLLDFNPQQDGVTFFFPEIRAVLEKNGARIFRSKALLAADPARVPEFKVI